MYYSQLYSCIRQACREIKCRQFSATHIAISMPLLVCVPSSYTYGAIVSTSVSPSSPPVSSLSIGPTTLLAAIESQLQSNVLSNTVSLLDNIEDQGLKSETMSLTVTAQNILEGDFERNSSTPEIVKVSNSNPQLMVQNAKNIGFTKSSFNFLDSNVSVEPSKRQREDYPNVSSTSSTPSDFDEDNQQDEYIGFDLSQTSSDKGTVASSDTVIGSDTTVGLDALEILDSYEDPYSLSNSGSDLPNEAFIAEPIHPKSPSTKGDAIRQAIDQSKQLSTRLNDENVQESLERLAQFYQLKTEDLNDNPTYKPSSSMRNRTDDSDHSYDSLNYLDARASTPVAAPELFNSEFEANASAHRCEGVWVTPSDAGAKTRYQEAIKKAQRLDGLSTVNGLPLYAISNYGYYDNDAYVELSGDVEVIQDGKLVAADQIILDLNTGIAGAKGRVILAEPSPIQVKRLSQLKGGIRNPTSKEQNGSGMILLADELAYNTENSKATAYDVAFASVPMQAHGYAKVLNKPDDTHYELEKVMFSTCPPTNRKWQVEAQQIDLDTETGRGEAYDATFRIGNVPVLYLPYFNFPIDDRRSSGLLTPTARIDSENGLSIGIPYYLNLAPNYDATLTTDIYTNRNPMLTGELRYLTDQYGSGRLTTAYLPNDNQYDEQNRIGIFYKHDWTSKSIPRLSANAIYSYVSDPDYLNDFDDFGVVENRLNLPRRASANYYNDYVDAQLKVETFQSLAATDADGNIIEDKDKPYSRMPQLSIDYRLPNINSYVDKFRITGVHDLAYFKKSINDGSESEKSGLRVFNQLNASYPIEKSWGYVIPKVSLQHLVSAYDEESRLDNNVSKEDNIQTIFVPKFSLDTGLNYFQSGSPLGLFDHTLGGYQLLSPRVKYSYSPYKEQSSIPNFDTRTASYDYDQLFADNGFLGHDRIEDSNNLAVGINYKYIDAMGVTRLDGSIGDQFLINTPKVTLDEKDALYEGDSTGVAWRSTVQPYRNIWFDFNGALNSDNDLNYITSQVRYRPTPNSLLNFGAIERKNDAITNQSKLSALTASLIVPISNNWRLLGQGQFDRVNDRFIDATFGVDYEDCCYGFSIYSRSYYNDLNFEDKPTRAVMAEFRINGLGTTSSRLSRHLDDKILGFEPVDKLW